jgi:hypothetical protein
MTASIREAFVGWLFSMASSANKKSNLAKAATLKYYDAGYPGLVSPHRVARLEC